jgi:hypothetical protein
VTKSFVKWKAELRGLKERVESAESALKAALSAMNRSSNTHVEAIEKDRAVLLIRGHFERFERLSK